MAYIGFLKKPPKNLHNFISSLTLILNCMLVSQFKLPHAEGTHAIQEWQRNELAVLVQLTLDDHLGCQHQTPCAWPEGCMGRLRDVVRSFNKQPLCHLRHHSSYPTYPLAQNTWCFPNLNTLILSIIPMNKNRQCKLQRSTMPYPLLQHSKCSAHSVRFFFIF